MTEPSFRSRKSKLDGFEHLVGVLPDKEVAEKAGVSIENVRTFRLRRGLPALWRGETVEILQAKEAFRSRRRKKPSRSGRKRRKKMYPRASKLDAFVAQLGDVPDRELAIKAGVTPENVRSFRLRRGIPARWRGEGRLVPADSGGRDGAAPVGGKTADPPVATGRFAFRVAADIDGQARDYVVLGSDMADAARQAGDRLRALHPQALLREISLVGEAL